MTGAERKLKSVLEWLKTEPAIPNGGQDWPEDKKSGFRHGYQWAQDDLEDIYNAHCPLGQAQPETHPLGSVRFDEATEEQFREFWEAAGFVIGGNYKAMWAEKFLNGFPDEITVFPRGWITLFSGDTGTSLGLSPTFQEALDALNELAATKIMGGWA